MTAKILDFVPRHDYNTRKWLDKLNPQVENPDALPLTALEIYSKIWLETLECLKRLVLVYKATGQWNEEVDRRMGKILRELEVISMQLAQYDPLAHLPKAAEPEGPNNA